MKKLIIILLALLTLAGCSQSSSSDAKISAEKEEVYFKYDGKNYTNNDAFQKLKAQQVGSYFEYIIASKAVELEGIESSTSTEEIEAQYQEMIDMYGEEMVNSYFGSKESYINQALISDSYITYQKHYVLDNIDKFISEHPTIKVEYITSKDKKKMNTFLNTVKKDKTLDFDNASEKAKFEEGETVVKSVIETATAGLPTEVTDILDTLEAGTVSDLIEIDNGDETFTYYLIKLVSKDAKTDYLDEYQDYIVNYGYAPLPSVIASEKHEIIMYDDDFNNTYVNIMAQNATTESDAQQ